MRRVLEQLMSGRDLGADAAADLMRKLADPTTEAAAAGAVLAALGTKGETAEEIRGFATAMRGLALAPAIDTAADAVDIVGTGGDGSGSLNLSTGAALLTAACGRTVIKHGNRSVSSLCGSADVLEALGYTLPVDGAAARRDADDSGFTFLFAPYFHPAMKAVVPVRTAMGVRTVFNLLGPLTNPAAPGYSVIGAPDPAIARMLAEALAEMPVRRAFVVHGALGWDEATPVGPFMLLDVRDGAVAESECDPLDYGVDRCRGEDLLGGDAAANAERLRRALGGNTGPDLDALCLGAGLALEVSGAVDDLGQGVVRARRAAAAGDAAGLLARLGAATTAGGVERV